MSITLLLAVIVTGSVSSLASVAFFAAVAFLFQILVRCSNAPVALIAFIMTVTLLLTVTGFASIGLVVLAVSKILMAIRAMTMS